MAFVSNDCVVCMDSDSARIFLPCKHKCCCSGCSSKIVQAKMDCPLCRSPIDKIMDADAIEVTAAQLKIFQGYKTEYLSKLQCSSNAGYTGKSRLARSVGREMGDTMEKLEMERKGSERYTCSNVLFSFVGDENDKTMDIAWKVGRKLCQDSVAFLNWHDANEMFCDEMSGDTITVLDMASFYPEYYWLWRYHNNNSNDGVEEALTSAGLLQNKRRRR